MRTVTLVTGDQVQLSKFADGKEGVTVRPGPGRERVSFAYQSRGESVTVIPSDALALLQRGAVDARLFDVKALVRTGYADDRRSTLPLIVSYQDGEAGKHARSALGRTTKPKAVLKSVNADVVTARKAETAEVWETMTRKSGRSRVLAPGVSRIWLDGVVKAALDKSVPQIGAPHAWQEGLTGKDVLTAVLDTGVDATHADLADAVAESKDFTGNPDGPADGNGHGTHVASIITGNGSASGGRYAGVAPDTRLLVGKVLSNKGDGSESQIIAGMEWATSRGARVINMSLGAGPTDGTDPMSQAVNSLTASTGALFVIAAGNTGGEQDVSSPAAADAALTVGAVDADDQLADFSSRGPRVGDQAVKPEITAPGVGIAAARAAGTDLGSPVDEHYTRLSGTSMATPHVAGAAVLLAQKHPDWNAGQLKAALTSTAKPTAGLNVFAQGTGRVDVTRAVRQDAYATPGTLSNYLKWPHTAPVTRTVTYHNDGDESLTLNLTVTLDASTGTGELITPEASQVTVPAHGTAETQLTINPAEAAPGTYSGMLTASSVDGETVIRTAVGVHNEAEVYDATIHVTDRAGQALPPAGIRLLNLDTGQGFSPRVVGNALVARVPKGRYSVDSLIYTYADGELQNMTLASRPDLQVSGDTSVSFDARAGKPVQAHVNGTTTRANIRWLGVNQTVAGSIDEFRGYTDSADIELYALPTPKVTSRPYTFVHLATLVAPAAAGRQEAIYNLALTRDGSIPYDTVFRIDSDGLASVHAHYHTQGEAAAGIRSALTAFDGSDRATGGFYDVSLPSKRIEYFSPASQVQWLSLVDTGTSFEQGPLTRYKVGKNTIEDWNKAPVSPFAQAARCEDFLLAPIFVFSPSAPGHTATAYEYTGEATLLRNGTEIATSDDPANAFFTGLPSEPSRYSLRLKAHRETPAVALATRVDAEWTFVSARPQGDCQQAEQPALLHGRINADVDLNNSAPAGRSVPVTINVEYTNGGSPDVKNLSLEASFDDGATWQHVTTYGKGRRFSAAIPPAHAGNGYVALRTAITDGAGNQLKQTVVRAYQQR
ncbi:S8 family serine peptidase [Streptomyces sp. NPDC004787]|uniref:S8 family serine peptidase n=1 Tax=Streptomyces sp. NPDC004787 TaxID=3154291 RepID=UPI0033BA3714